MSALVHAIWTLVLFVVFIGIVLWAYSGRRKKDFEEAARLALDDEQDEQPRRRNHPDN